MACIFKWFKGRMCAIVLAAVAAFILSMLSGATSAVFHQVPHRLNPSDLMPGSIERLVAPRSMPKLEPLFPVPVNSPILAWDTTGITTPPTTYNSTTADAHLNVSVLSRGAGLNSASLMNGFSSNDFTAGGTFASAVSNNDYLQFVVNPVAGYKVSLSTLDANFRRSATGPNTSLRVTCWAR